MNSDIKKIGVADIFRAYGEAYRQHHFVTNKQQKVMNHIKACRTAELGGHVEHCNACEFERISYNSCRDRHCPLCQTMVKEQWLNDRKAELLPCGYFHLVFTLPHDLKPLSSATRRRPWAFCSPQSTRRCRPLPGTRLGGSMGD